MQSRNVIIDGYNLLLQSRFGRYLSIGGQLKSARMALVRFLSLRMDQLERQSVVIVFDAKEIDSDHPESIKYEGLKVEFAVNYAEADDRIEELIQQHPHPTELVVVSGDRRLHRAAQKKNSKYIDPLEWLDQFTNRPSSAPSQSNSSPQSAIELLPADAPIEFEQDDIDFEQWAAFYELDDQEIDDLMNDVLNEVDTKQKDGEPATNEPEIENPFPPGYGEDLLEED